MALTKEEKDNFKKGKIDECDREIADLESAITDFKNQRDKELEKLESKLDSLKYQKELYG